MNVVETVMFFLGVLGYALSLLCVVRYLRMHQAGALRGARTLAALGVFMHTAYLVYHGIEDRAFPVDSLFEAVVFLGVMVLIIGLAIDLFRSMPLVTVVTVPMVLPMFVTALAFMPGHTVARTPNLFISVHTMVTLLSYAAFGLAFIMGLIYLFEHRQLKTKPQSGLFELLPSIEVIYKFNVRAMLVGLVLLTAGILMGYMYGRTAAADLKTGWRLDPKVLLSAFTWAAYLIVWILSLVPSLRGRRIAMASVLCFSLVMLTLMASLFWDSFHRYM